jgi:hypothetical protein
VPNFSTTSITKPRSKKRFYHTRKHIETSCAAPHIAFITLSSIYHLGPLLYETVKPSNEHIAHGALVTRSNRLLKRRKWRWRTQHRFAVYVPRLFMILTILAWMDMRQVDSAHLFQRPSSAVYRVHQPIISILNVSKARQWIAIADCSHNTTAFKTWYRVAEGLNVGGLICLVFLMVSFVCLPAEKTRRHYLSYCLIIAAIFLALGFVIPFGTRPAQCYDEITPNDMFSNLTCAFSGAFLIAGGLSMAIWSKLKRANRWDTHVLTRVQSSFAHYRCIFRFAGT